MMQYLYPHKPMAMNANIVIYTEKTGNGAVRNLIAVPCIKVLYSKNPTNHLKNEIPTSKENHRRKLQPCKKVQRATASIHQ